MLLSRENRNNIPSVGWPVGMQILTTASGSVSTATLVKNVFINRPYAGHCCRDVCRVELVHS